MSVLVCRNSPFPSTSIPIRFLRSLRPSENTREFPLTLIPVSQLSTTQLTICAVQGPLPEVGLFGLPSEESFVLLASPLRAKNGPKMTRFVVVSPQSGQLAGSSYSASRLARVNTLQ